MTRPVRNSIIGAALAAAAASLVGFGILGKGRGSDAVGNTDGAVLYAAGRAWSKGLNPYDHRDLTTAVADVPEIKLDRIRFFYLPQSSPLCLFLAQFSYPVARQLWLVINLLSIAALAGMSIFLVRRSTGGQEDVLGMGLLAAVVIGNPFTTHVVWMGQTSLLATAFAFGSWILIQQKRWLPAGILLGLASFKPQLFVLVGLWLILEREWKVLLVGFAVSSLLCVHAMLTHGGPGGMVTAWRGGVESGYLDLRFNRPGDPHVPGLGSLMAAAGVRGTGLFFMIIGVALASALWNSRRHFQREDVLALLMGLTFVFLGYSHDYDFVALVPLFVALWLHGRDRPRACIQILPLVILLFLPSQFVRKLHVPVLEHWRTIVILALTVALAVYSRKRTAENDDVKT